MLFLGMRARKYIVGESWGQWTIIEYPQGGKKILLRCECGEERWRALANMAKTKEQRCRQCTVDFSGSMKTFYMVKGRAKTRGIEFLLSYEDWQTLVAMPCHYCGSDPSNCVSKYKFVYNGIDRVDTNAAYSLWNCVPACKVCNRSKSDMTQKKFYEWIYRVGTNNGLNFASDNSR